MAAPATRHHLARPPYVDPNTNIIYDTDSPEYEGWLTKQSMWLKVRMRRRRRIMRKRVWRITVCLFREDRPESVSQERQGCEWL
jgi:hypothetical protein